MFAKITSTEYPPAIRPIMVWDGNCPFCKFWVEYLKRLTADRIDYAPFQEVNDCFGDIPMEAFKGAVQFIEPDGKVYSGPDTAYRSLLYTKRPVPLFHRLYHQYGLSLIHI